MPVFKCKMCGGDIEFNSGDTVGLCDHCGTKQTLPRLEDDRRANLYDRANHFRRNNDFDKAMNIYEQILNEDNTDAETYWSLVLCRYGIEYVEDPSTHRQMPTVNRAQYTSIYMDEDYKSALEYADSHQRELYEAEAKEIDNIQKGILEISSKEEPFDVFICYKESDANGRRTPDSVLATELYHELTREGYKVFFSRITLEDKLGIAYEPYIFAALNSAKVMTVLGTRADYFNAVWVKNEWSRYLALIRKGERKTLIPAYRDMDPYDLPEEFSHLQALDMSRLGFMQDLIRGIKKIVDVEKPKETVKETAANNNGASAIASPFVERMFYFLEDGKWQDADIYAEKVLDIEPKNAEAYLGKLMAELRVKTRKELGELEDTFVDRENCAKVLRFGDKKIQAEIQDYLKQIDQRKEENRISSIYDKAVSKMRYAETRDEFREAAELFRRIPGYEDSDSLAEDCTKKAEDARKEEIYRNGVFEMNRNQILSYERAISSFKTIPDWKDSNEKIDFCRTKIEEIKKKEENERLEAERREEERLDGIYSKALSDMSNADSEESFRLVASTFQSIPEYKDARILAKECQKRAEDERNDKFYNYGAIYMSEGDVPHYEKAVEYFEKCRDWKDSNDKVNFCYRRIDEIKTAEKKAKERRRKRRIVLGSTSAVIVTAVVIAVYVLYGPTIKYNGCAVKTDQQKIDCYVSVAGVKDADEQKDAAFVEYINHLVNNRDYAGVLNAYAANNSNISGYECDDDGNATRFEDSKLKEIYVDALYQTLKEESNDVETLLKNKEILAEYTDEYNEEFDKEVYAMYEQVVMNGSSETVNYFCEQYKSGINQGTSYGRVRVEQAMHAYLVKYSNNGSKVSDDCINEISDGIFKTKKEFYASLKKGGYSSTMMSEAEKYLK